MRRLPHMTTRFLAVLGAGLLAASMWLWLQGIAIPHQLADSAVHGIPRGNLSDLYPRWLGARELLLRGRDPYSLELTREIQAGYYGRPIDPARPNDPKDQQAFAYPLYVVFLLFPTVKAPFPIIQEAFLWLLVGLTAVSVPLWLRAIGWRLSRMTELTWIVFALGCWPAMQGFKLQQLTLLVAFLLAASMYALSRRQLVLAGILLGIASIKPQLVGPLCVWLLLWVIGNWRERQRLLWSFAACMAVLVIAGELFLPGWIHEFRAASVAYYHYTGGGTSVLDEALTPAWGRVAAIALVAAVVLMVWRVRRATEGTPVFCWSLALVLTSTVIVIPMFAPYNQLLLLPVFMMIVRSIGPLWRSRTVSRFLVEVTALAVLWPSLAAASLVLARVVLPGPQVERAWALPLYTSFDIPIILLVFLLVDRNVLSQEIPEPAGGSQLRTLREGAGAE